MPSADPLVVPGISLVSQIIGHLVTTLARLLICQLAQLLDQRFRCASLFSVAINTTTDLQHAERAPLTHPKFLPDIAGQLPFLGYLESFFR